MTLIKISQEAHTRFQNYIKINPETNCWEFMGNRDKDGYGKIRIGNGKRIRTHRLAVLLSGIEIPKGMFVCHRCDNPPCVNLQHLYVGTNQDNQKENFDKGRHNVDHGNINGNKTKTHCKWGHEFTVENTRIIYKNGEKHGRGCKQCAKNRYL
jgi:hypothetical protein